MGGIKDTFSSVGEITPERYVIVVLLLLIIIPLIITSIVFFKITSSVYQTAYNLSYIFLDSAGSNPFIGINLVLFSNNFDILTLVILIDGFMRIVVIGILFGFLIDWMTKANIKSKLSEFRLKIIRNHVIICGYSGISETVCKKLKELKIKFVVIDNNDENIELLEDLKYNNLKGKFVNKKVLKRAFIKNSRAIIFASDDDLDNLLGIITARNMNKKLLIISKASSEKTVSKMHRAGASLCVIPEMFSGVEIGREIIKHW